MSSASSRPEVQLPSLAPTLRKLNRSAYQPRSAHARALAPGHPLGLVGYSFGALMALRWVSRGGDVDALVLVGLPIRSVTGRDNDLPPVPDGTFIVAAERDQFGTVAELRERFPLARVAEVRGADHFFVGQRDEMARLVTDELARTVG